MPPTRTLLPSRKGSTALAPSLAGARARALPATSRTLAAPRARRPVAPTQWKPLAVGGPAGPEQRPGGLAGLWNNATEMVSGFIPGIAHFVGDALTDVIAVPRIAVDLAKGDFEPEFERYLPGATGITKSFGRTAQDIAQPQRFVEAFEQGDLVSKIVEDVGNVAIVGGAIAKGIGAGASTSSMTARQAGRLGATEATPAEIARAGLPELSSLVPEGALGDLAQVGAEPLGYYTHYKGLAGRAARSGNLEQAAQLNTVANKVRGVATLGERVGNAPALPFQWGGRLVGKGLQATGLGEALTSRLPWRLSEQGRLTRRTGDVATTAGVRLTRAAVEPMLLSKELNLSQAEDRAAIITLTTSPDNLAQYNQLDEFGAYVLDDQALGDVLNNKYADWEDSARPTVEDARTAAKYSAGELAPETMKAIEAVQGKVRDVAEARKQRAIDEGLHPEQLDTKLRGTVVAEHRTFLEGLKSSYGRALDKVQTQAARHERNLRVQDALANDLPDPTLMNRPQIRAELEAKQGQLAAATDVYEQALANGTDAQKMAAAAKVDVLLDEAEAIKTQAGWMRPERSVFTGGRDAEGNMLREGRPTGNPSPNERIRQRQGTLAERHARAQQAVKRIEDRIATVDERLANVEADLSRSYQERFHTDVNLPSVKRLTNAMFKGTARLGTLLRRQGRGDLAKAFEEGAISGEAILRQLDDEGIVLSPEQRAQFEHSIKAETAAAQITEHMESLVDDETGQRLVAPVDVKNIIDTAALPEQALPAVEGAWDTYLERRAKVAAKVFNDQTEAMPARFRTAAMDGQRQAAALIEQGIEANKDVPGSGDGFLQMAEETVTTLAEMVDAGFDPTHLTGGRAVSAGSAAGRGYTQGRLTRTRLRGEHVRRRGIMELGTEAYGRVEAQQANRWVINKRNEHLATTMGRRVDSFPEVQGALAEHNDLHPGEVMPPATLDAVLRQVKDENGVEYASMNAAQNLRPDSMVVPKNIYEQFQPPGPMGAGWRALARTNQAFKTWVLPFSGRWQVGNALGNVLQSSMHGGMSPLELARIARGVVREEGGWRALWRQEGLAGGLPAELSESGLTHGEMASLFGAEQAPARTRLGRGVQWFARGSYKFNSTVDNLTRSSLFLAKLAEGQGTEAATRTTLRALGDYTKLTPLERHKVRQIFPFYTWLRHSLTATARLPVVSPTRALFYAHLQTLYQDDPELAKIVGQGFRVGDTGILDFGSLIPLADIGGEGALLNLQNYGASLAPAIKLASAVGFGWDLNAMKPVSRPGGAGAGAISPLSQFANNPLAAAGEIAWQASQQGPGQIKNIRDLVLGNQVRYSGTGYTTEFENENRRSLWQIARILSLPNMRYDPRLQKGAS